MLKHETVTILQAIAAVCDRCDRELRKRAHDGEWEERISIAFRGGYHSIFGDGNAVELDLCQHCLKETLGPWLRITDDGWPKAVPLHAGQECQRRIQPDSPDDLEDFNGGGEVEVTSGPIRGFPRVEGPIEGLKSFFEEHGVVPEEEAQGPSLPDHAANSRKGEEQS